MEEESLVSVDDGLKTATTVAPKAAGVARTVSTDSPDDRDPDDLDQDQDVDQEADQEQEETSPSGSGDSLSLTPPVNQTHRSSSRKMRNLAEKARRDKLNNLINKLANLVPMVSVSSKKLDKTSILRLSATFIRMHQLLKEDTALCHQTPQFFDSINWAQIVLEDIAGMMLIVTAGGKIIFVSSAVEKMLNYPQLELFGQDLEKITLPEDRDTLRRNLMPDFDPDTTFLQSQVADSSVSVSNEDSCSSGDTVTFSGSSCSDQSCGQGVSSGSGVSGTTWSSSGNQGNVEYEKQKRSFFIRLQIRSTSKSVKAQYEYVHIHGHLRVPVVPRSAAGSTRSKNRETVISANEVYLIAVVKPFKEIKVSDLSLLEWSKEMYKTQHEMNGNFLYTDQRISTVAGYLAYEVKGESGFNYMHKDDVGWVLVALRQMLIESNGPGLSCYRLKTKTGKFIHMRTLGFVVQNDEGQAETFICINTLITEEEFNSEFAALRQRFTPMIENQSEEPGLNAIASVLSENGGRSSPEQLPETKDPNELTVAVKTLISDVKQVNPNIKESLTSSSGEASTSASCQQLVPVNSSKLLEKSVIAPPGRPPCTSLAQDRPSVLRVKHSDTVSVVSPNSVSFLARRKSVVSHSSQAEVSERLAASPGVSEQTVVCSHDRDSVVKVKRKSGAEEGLNSLCMKRQRCELPARSPEAASMAQSPPSLVNSSLYSSSTLDTSSSSSSLSSSMFGYDSALSQLELDKPQDLDSLGLVVGDCEFNSDTLGALQTGVDDVQSIINPVLHPPESWGCEPEVLRRNHVLLDSSLGLQEQQLASMEHNTSQSLVTHHVINTTFKFRST
ncbi:unnamed protein product [Bemisia tabaci]|uniref:Methoprene-tolerant protein n=1 Tax=Bemisia tabaci TaxID=7038 RepID=A0A9P0C8W3_BEMTA|nr:unnamed protein product [Bemisia tabaci]